MSNKLNTLNKEELLAVARMFGSDQVNKDMTKAKMVSELESDGVTYEDYQKILLDTQKQEADDELSDVVDPSTESSVEAPEEDDRNSLLRMTRPNFSYQVRGYQFSKQHPFALVSETDVDYLVDVVRGFRPATPRELSQFYGKE
jgi:hypothetical protein